MREMVRRMNMARAKGTECKRRTRRKVKTTREHLLRKEVQEVKRMVEPVPSSFLQYGPSMIFTRR